MMQLPNLTSSRVLLSTVALLLLTLTISAQNGDTTPPTGRISVISNPNDQGIYNQTPLLLQVEASDASGIQRVEFWARSERPWSNGDWRLIAVDESAPYQASWDLRTIDDGSVTLSAYIVDNAGNGVALLGDDAPTITVDRSSAFFSCEEIRQISVSQCQALRDMYDANGFIWGWFINDEPCNWRGIRCNGLGSVTHITANGRGLGVVPSSIDDLTSLEWLNLSHNSISTLPPEIANLSRLQGLYVTQNHLNGSVPSFLTTMDNLRWLDLSRNQLSGAIPDGFGSRPNLEMLNLSNNELTGPLPENLSNAANLNGLYLSNNRIDGSIPSTWGNGFNQLEWLYLNFNQLTEPIPPALTQIDSLRLLELNSNRLTGEIPSGFGSMPNLETLILSNNALSGEIPTDLAQSPELGRVDNLSELEEIDLRFNRLRTADVQLRNWLNTYHPSWEATQTVAPANLRLTSVSTTSVSLAWDGIPYTGTLDEGIYEVLVAPWNTPLELVGTTSDLQTTTFTVNDLNEGTRYSFCVRSVTPIHTDQPNTLISDCATTDTFTTTTGSPDINLSNFNVTNDHILNGRMNVTFTVRNEGGVALAQGFDVLFTYTTSGTCDGSGLSLGTLSYGALNAGDTTNVNQALSVPRNQLSILFNDASNQDTPGSAVSGNVARICALADFANVIAEEDESDNVAFDDVTYFPWDVNGDGLVTPADAIFVINRQGRTAPFSSVDRLADLNGDDVINDTDVNAVLDRLGMLRADVID